MQNETIIGLRMSGTITQDDIKPWAVYLDMKSEQPGKLQVYTEGEDVDVVTLKAAWQDLTFDLSHLGVFEKGALVTDQNWIKLPASVANLMPGFAAKQFTRAQKEAAQPHS